MQLKTVQAAVPTNVITGFLGVGKTSAIQHLLKYKPENERWAVLINEFGKVGIDRQMLNSVADDATTVEIREVTGGCMCCTASLPMQVALNQLLRTGHFDRLLIEPSGLGHPEEVIATLTRAEYRGILDLRATLTLVDARHFKDSRYTEHAIFLQQLRIADCIVMNKADLCDEGDIRQLEQQLSQLKLDAIPVMRCEQARVDPVWLISPSAAEQVKQHNIPMFVESNVLQQALPESGYLCEFQQLDGWYSCGWRFLEEWLFDFEAILDWCKQQQAHRLKAVINTEQGTLMINQVEEQGRCRITKLNTSSESRLEMIVESRPDVTALQQALLDCVVESVSP